MPEDSLEIIGSPEHADYSYGSQLECFLTAPRLKRAVIASAFLTEAAAELLGLWIWRRSFIRSSDHPEIIFIVGSMQNFTRRAAIQHLLKCQRRYKRFASLSILRPRTNLFHAKAAYFWSGRRHFGIVGSHNLTEFGLNSSGELGVQLCGKPATRIRDSIDTWITQSDPWSKSISKYRESGQRPPTGGTRQPKRGTGRETIGEVASAVQGADCCEVDHALDRSIRRQIKQLLGMRGSGYNYILLEGTTQESAIDDHGYLTGACFDTSRDIDEDDWYIGQKRAIHRISHLLPIDDGAQCVLLYEPRAMQRYVVDADTLARAEDLGICDDDASTGDMLEFIEYLTRHRGKR